MKKSFLLPVIFALFVLTGPIFLAGQKGDFKGTVSLKNGTKIINDLAKNTANAGYCLYTTKLPFIPMSIRDGHMYHTTYSEETSDVKVIRYRIKNWDQVLSARN
jgi:hypothetical protein